MECDTLVKEHVLKNVASKIIVDDVLLYGRTEGQLLSYLRTFRDVFKYHHATLKLKKRKWFKDRRKFLGMDVVACETKYTQSKNEAFARLEIPSTCGYLCMLIGVLGLYIQFFPLYEMDIRPWR